MTTEPVKIAVEGCCHGELNQIYRSLSEGIDLLIICGDFQALRNLVDLETIAVPQKYRRLGDFHEYYSGKRKAPVLTLFIGGNHEASSYLKELKYGGWVAPSIYYLGEFGVVNFRGVCIGGISGIYNRFTLGNKRLHFDESDEPLPFGRDTMKTVYHVKPKNYLKMLISGQFNRMDIVLSHDWPQGIENHGNVKELLRSKPFFKQDIQHGQLGSPLNRILLDTLKPRYWFSAHLHVHFEAQVKHILKRRTSLKEAESTKKKRIENSNHDKIALDMDMEDSMAEASTSKKKNGAVTAKYSGLIQQTDTVEEETRFLALDKCLPRRKYLKVFDIEPVELKSIYNVRLSENHLYHDRVAVATNKVIETFVRQNKDVWESIHTRDFYNFMDLQANLYKELEDEIKFEISRLESLPTLEFQISPDTFEKIAPTSEEKSVTLKYWENNQTVDYCSKYNIPYDLGD